VHGASERRQHFPASAHFHGATWAGGPADGPFGGVEEGGSSRTPLYSEKVNPVAKVIELHSYLSHPPFDY
jgi:hypothetical protein